MKTSQLTFRWVRAIDNKTSANSLLARTASILIISLCIGFILGCSGSVGSPEINYSGGGFQKRNSGFTAEKTYKKELLVENYARVNIEAINGKIVVTGGGDANTVAVTAYLSVDSDSWQDAEMHLGDLEILTTDNADEVLIRTVQPKISEGRQYHVEYDIIVPSRFEVIAAQVNGSIDILNIENNVAVSNVNGDVFLYSIVGGVAADVENGSIEGTVFLPVDQAIDLYTDNGSIELSIPTSASAEFFATAENAGEIIVSDLDIIGGVKTKQSLTGVIGDGEGLIELNVVNGNIKVFGFD